MKKNRLPKKVRTVLRSCPASGRGIHEWMFGAATRLRGFCSDPETTVSLLRQATKNCGRQVPDEEIRAVVRDSYSAIGVKQNNPPFKVFCRRVFPCELPPGDFWKMRRTGNVYFLVTQPRPGMRLKAIIISPTVFKPGMTFELSAAEKQLFARNTQN
jgi:hypothetical protein